MGQFKQPDHTKGDPNTLGGYIAVHDRPAAFEAPDGISYSVEIVTDLTDNPAAPYASYLLFVRWREGDPVAAGHLESAYLAHGLSEQEARAPIAGMMLEEVRSLLFTLSSASQPADRPWWEAMNDELPS